MQEFLTKHNQRAIRFGKEPELSLNGSMSASKRVDALSELIAALEKSFPVTDLTGAMIGGLKKLKLKCLSDLDEHFESIYNYLGKIYEAEMNDPHYAKLPGYYEQHDLQSFVVGHFSQLSKTLDKHIKLGLPATARRISLFVVVRLIFSLPCLVSFFLLPWASLVVRTLHPLGSMRAPRCPSRFTTLHVGLGGIM